MLNTRAMNALERIGAIKQDGSPDWFTYAHPSCWVDRARSEAHSARMRRIASEEGREAALIQCVKGCGELTARKIEDAYRKAGRPRRANLRPGAAQDVRPGDRWLVRLRGAAAPVPARVEKRRPRGRWRVVLEPSLLAVEVDQGALARRLGPSDVAQGYMAPDQLAVELRRLRSEVARLASEVQRLRDHK